MDFNSSDDEQVEALKKWWAENGRSLVVGLVLGISGIFGWQYWQGYTAQRAEVASLEYELMIVALKENKAREVESRAEQLVLNFSSTPYAALAGLAVARSKVDAGDMVGAQPHLQWVIDNASDAAVKALAAYRLARVTLSAGDAAGAKVMIPEDKPVGFAAHYAELEGDIAFSLGNTDSARKAYAVALELMDTTAARRSLVQMKKDDLGAS